MADPLDMFRSYRPPQLGMNYGLRALARQPRTSGIDFMAIARGEQMARAQNWQDRLRRQAAERMRLQQINWNDRLEQRNQNQTASHFLSTLSANRQDALNAGFSQADFLIQQRRQMLADPDYTELDPETQQLVMQRYNDTVKDAIDNLYQAGNWKDAYRLSQDSGLVSPVGEIDLAARSGDVEAVVNELQSRGADIQLLPNGQVEYNGQLLDQSLVMGALRDAPRDASQLSALNAQIMLMGRQEEAAGDQAYRNYVLAGAGRPGDIMSRAEFDALFSGAQQPAAGATTPTPAQAGAATATPAQAGAQTATAEPTPVVPLIPPAPAQASESLALVKEAIAAGTLADLARVNPETIDLANQALASRLQAAEGVTFAELQAASPEQRALLAEARSQGASLSERLAEARQGGVTGERSELVALANSIGDSDITIQAYARENPVLAEAQLERIDELINTLSVLPEPGGFSMTGPIGSMRALSRGETVQDNPRTVELVSKLRNMARVIRESL